MISAVLSDMDGTLIDTEFANANSYCIALAGEGIQVSPNFFISNYAGMSWRTFLPLILPEGDDFLYKKISERKKKIYQENISDTKIYTSALQAIQLFAASVPVALVTTASRDAVDALINYHRLNNLFSVIITGDDVTNHKPDPEAYITAAKRLRVNIKDCLIIEDSPVGIRSAKASGASVLVVSHEK